MSDGIIWQVPPASDPPTRAQKVAFKLRQKPGEWALISVNDPTMFMTWWGPIHNDDEYETRLVRKGQTLFGPRDIYARYIGPQRVPNEDENYMCAGCGNWVAKDPDHNGNPCQGGGWM